jgi:hypothetical protein
MNFAFAYIFPSLLASARTATFSERPECGAALNSSHSGFLQTLTIVRSGTHCQSERCREIALISMEL